MKKILFKIILILGGLILLSFILIEGLIICEGRKTANVEVDYVVVLGARLYGDVPSPALTERLKEAEKYLKQNKDIKVVVSGGQGIDELIPEAHAMETYLVNNGIEADRIIIEDISTSTFENLILSLDKIREIDDKENLRILIVTNKYHIFRSKLIARRLGIDPFGLPAKIPPTIILKSYIREYFAVIKSFFFDKPANYSSMTLISCFIL